MKSRLIIVWVVEEREVWRPNTPALCPTHKQISDSFDVLRNYADRRIVSDNIRQTSAVGRVSVDLAFRLLFIKSSTKQMSEKCI